MVDIIKARIHKKKSVTPYEHFIFDCRYLKENCILVYPVNFAMNRKILRLLRFLPKIVLSVVLTGTVFVVLSHQIKIEVTTLTDKKITPDPPPVVTTTVVRKPSTTVTTTVSTTTQVTTEDATTAVHDPRVSFDKVINPHPFKYKLLPSGVCNSNADQNNPHLLILVKSNVFQIGHRMAIRSTWGNFTNNSTIQLAFLLGDSTLVQSFTEMEYEMYGDIIQENFIDEYKNNTLKTIMGFNWAVSHCSQAKFVMFVDDDYFVNIPNLSSLVSNISNSSVFRGYRYKNAVVRRRKESKWYISKEEYPDKLWPPYISGGSMLISMDVVKDMAVAFPHVKPVFIDDVYLGIVAKILNITLTHDRKFEVKYLPEKFDSLIASHDFGSPNVLIQEWNEIGDEENTKK